MMDSLKYKISVDNKDVLKAVKQVQQAIEKLNKTELKLNITTVEKSRKWWKIW